MNVMPTKYFKNFTILKYFYSIFVLYAKLEEEHGLGRHAMAVYDRAIDAVELEEGCRDLRNHEDEADLSEGH